MAIDYAAEAEELRARIAAGVTRASYDGKSVEYDDDLNKMLARLRWLEDQASPNDPSIARPMAGYATFCRD